MLTLLLRLVFMPEKFTIVSIPSFSIDGAAKTVLLGILCAAVSILLCIILHKVGGLLKTYIKNVYLRAIVSALIVIVFAFLLPGGKKLSWFRKQSD